MPVHEQRIVSVGNRRTDAAARHIASERARTAARAGGQRVGFDKSVIGGMAQGSVVVVTEGPDAGIADGRGHAKVGVSAVEIDGGGMSGPIWRASISRERML